MKYEAFVALAEEIAKYVRRHGKREKSEPIYFDNEEKGSDSVSSRTEMKIKALKKFGIEAKVRDIHRETVFSDSASERDERTLTLCYKGRVILDAEKCLGGSYVNDGISHAETGRVEERGWEVMKASNFKKISLYLASLKKSK